jgi:peptidoglycan/LPS O-acetylase OafA/YrhL
MKGGRDMPDIGYTPKLQSDIALRPGGTVGRIVLVGAAVAAMAMAMLATTSDETARAVQAAGPELTRLLRAMAGLKLMVAGLLLAAVYWRMALPAPPWRLTSYTAAGAAMVAGPVLIWDMGHIPLGALLLHGGLLAAALLLWRDPAVGARLGAVVARRRAIVRARG